MLRSPLVPMQDVLQLAPDSKVPLPRHGPGPNSARRCTTRDLRHPSPDPDATRFLRPGGDSRSAKAQVSRLSSPNPALWRDLPLRRRTLRARRKQEQNWGWCLAYSSVPRDMQADRPDWSNVEGETASFWRNASGTCGYRVPRLAKTPVSGPHLWL